jgi:predicted nucleic acid-binding protein
MASADAARIAGYWLDVFPNAAESADAVRDALVSATEARASYWDALPVATAAEAGCTVILTEDLAAGTTMHGVQILNPFTDTNPGPLVSRFLAEE